jgi:hypothetical protein
MPDGCGNVNDCGSCPAGMTCGGGGIPNQCSSGGGTPDAAPPPPSDAGPACQLDVEPVGSCQNHPKPLCGPFPGTVVSNCTNNDGGGGYTATCCPSVP